MASIRCALVPSALACMAMFLQGCGTGPDTTVYDKNTDAAAGGFATVACDTLIEESMLVAKNNSLTELATACQTVPAVLAVTAVPEKPAVGDEPLVPAVPPVTFVAARPATPVEIQECSAYGSELIRKVFVRVKENNTATCVEYVAACEKVEVSELDEKKNTTSYPEKVKAWTAANMPTRIGSLDKVLDLCIVMANTRDPPTVQQAADRAYQFTGMVTPESEAFGDANSALMDEFAMSGGNKIQAMSTSHAGRWVASACGVLMVMAGVFRFSRRAWLTPSTETDMVKLVNEEDVEGRCEHIAE